MNDDPERRVNGQGDAIHQAVRYLDGIDGERADLEAFAGLDLVEHGIIEQRVLFQLALDVGERELGTVHRNIELGEQPGQPSDVVFMAVGKDNGAHAFTIFEQVAEVGDDDVDAQQLGFGEHQARVDDDDVVTPANGHTVHSEFAESAERYDLKFSGWHVQSSMLAQGCARRPYTESK